MNKKSINWIFIYVFLCHYNCKQFKHDNALNCVNVVDTTILVDKSQALRIVKCETARCTGPRETLSNVRLDFENLSDSSIILCCSVLSEGILDSIFYRTYAMDWEYLCCFIQILPNSKLSLVEPLTAEPTSGYLISYELVPNFSVAKYEEYFDVTKAYKSHHKNFLWIGINAYPPKTVGLEITRTGIRVLPRHY